jgi:crotonobetainyl-CoA:carnitine CoA-transferase CaiB-like acyl-CoA transferase
MPALTGITILDLTHMVSGPYCSMLLADLGADVIKVEPPGTGEGTRSLLAKDPDHSVDGQGAYFLTLSRNKQSVAIDLKSAEGADLFRQLAAKADVVLENFSPGVTKRLGIDHATLAPINPRLICCSISGFGQTGPSAGRTAFDIVAQAMGGGMSITGEPDGRPLRAGIPLGDLGSGLFATIGILAALEERSRTGKGQAVDISMQDCQVSLLSYMATMYLLSGINPDKLGNGHFAHVPYDTFRTKTRDLVIAVVTDQQWAKLAEMLDEPSLKNPAYATQPGRFRDKHAIMAKVQEILSRETCETWLARLDETRVPSAPVNDFEHALNDPQIKARNMVVDMTMPGGRVVQVPGNPIKLSNAGAEHFVHAPLLGADTDAVLTRRLGLGADVIAALRKQGVIA